MEDGRGGEGVKGSRVVKRECRILLHSQECENDDEEGRGRWSYLAVVGLLATGCWKGR